MTTLRRALRLARVAGFAALLAAYGVAAAPDATAEREIDHLLDYVAASNCTFMRNGESFPAIKAREHLAMKYRFARSRLATAEDFIKYLATESSSSGDPYRIVCDRKEAPAGPWLTAELRRYRQETARR
jgi:hypothetical protein